MATGSYDLMHHQSDGVQFLLHRRSGLVAFEQGLGKTLVVIDAFARLSAQGSVDLLLVISPNSLKRTWMAELARFAPGLTAEITDGARRRRRHLLATTHADVVIINYETARNEITALRAIMCRRKVVLVLDESHYVKNMVSINNAVARHLAPLTDYRWLLTGTPVTNTASDLYAQINIIADDKPLGAFDSFTDRYGNVHKDPQHRAELAARAAPYMIRRTKEECLDLPERTYVDLEVDLPPWQRRLYDAVRDGILAEVEGLSPDQFRKFLPTALTRLLRLSQIASNPALVVSDEHRDPVKFKEIDRLLDELVRVNHRKVIVWSYYVGSIKQLAERYAEHGTAALYGDVRPDDRQDIVERFQGDDELRVLIANPAVAATGLTLTAATYAIYETLSWRYDLYAQSQDRNHRIGQASPVTYIRVIATDTVEGAIVQALERKSVFARQLVGDKDPEFAIAEMSPKTFIEIVKSGKLPVADDDS